MDKMQVILKEDVASLGRSGELVWVKPGYGRNYLIPQGLALVATRRNVTRLEHERKQVELHALKLRQDAEGIARKIAGVTLQLERSIGEGDKMFGSVTGRDIAEALAAEELKVDHRKIQLDEPIKALGQYTVDGKLARDVTAQVKVWVVAKQA